MEKNKVKIPKIILDVIGYSFGIGSSLYWTLVFRRFLKYGGVVLYEKSKLISTIELGATLFGTGFFTYKLLSMIKESDRYIKKRNK